MCHLRLWIAYSPLTLVGEGPGEREAAKNAAIYSQAWLCFLISKMNNFNPLSLPLVLF